MPNLVIGKVGENHARIWVRGSHRYPVAFVSCSNDDGSEVEKIAVPLDKEHGYIGVIDLQQLSAFTRYTCEVSYGKTVNDTPAERMYPDDNISIFNTGEDCGPETGQSENLDNLPTYLLNTLSTPENWFENILSAFRQIICLLIVPAVLILLSGLIVWKWNEITHKINDINELKAFMVLLPVLPYAIFFVGIIMGWRYNNTPMVLALFTIGLSYLILVKFHEGKLPESVSGLSIVEILTFLLPLNLAFFTILSKRWIFSSTGALSVILVLAQVFAVALITHAGESNLLMEFQTVAPGATVEFVSFSNGLHTIMCDRSLFGLENVSTVSVFSFTGALIFLLIRFIQKREATLAGFFGTLIAIFMGISTQDITPSCTVYFASAGLILIFTTIEASYSMAYNDELTGLPGRRSLNETLLNLGKKFSIAMIDVDHFKKFNDTYGHQAGDQVLMMIAAKLRAISGGAKPFRYGGEEFAAVFRGKTSDEILAHLDKFRSAVESTAFVVRSKDRRKGSAKKRGKNKFSGQKVTVTVSVGIASSDKNNSDPNQVLMEADLNLYKAKENGRNRIEN